MLLNKKNILFFILVGLVISYSASVPRERDITVMPIVPICDEGKTGGCATPPIYETLIMMEINSTEPNSIMANMLVIGVNRFNVSDRISMNNVPIYYFAVCSDNKKIIRNSITDPDGILTVNITDFMKTCSDCSIVVFRYCPVVHTEQGLRGCLAINESLAYYGLSTMNELYSRENNTIDSQTYSYCESTKGDVDRTTCLLITLMFAFLGGAMYLAGGSPFRMVGFTRTKMPKTRMYQMRPKSMSFTMMGISSLGGKLVSGALKKVGKGKGGGEESESGNDEGSEGTGGNPEQDANFVGPPEAPSKAPPKMFRADSKMSKAMAKVRGGYVKVVNFATKPTQTLGKAMGKIPIVGGLGIREEKGGQQVKDPRLASMGVSGGGSSALDSIANPKQISGTNFGEIFSSVASTIMGQLYQGMLNHYTGGLGGYAFQGLEKLGSKKQWTGFLKVLRVVQNPVGTLDNWVQNRNVVRMKKKLDKTLDGMQEGGTFTQQDKENKEKTNSRIEGLLADKIKIENIDPTTGHTSINIDGKKFVLDSRDIGSLGSGDFGVIGQHIASGLQTAQHMAILLYRGSFWNALENFRKDYANAKSEKEKEMITGKFELFLKTNGIDAYDPGQMSFGENLKNFVTGKSGPKTVGELRKNIARTYNGMLGNIGTAFVSMSLDLKAAEQMRLYGGVMPEEAMEMLSLGDEYQNIKKKLDTQLEKIKDLEREAAEAKANGDDELSDTLLRKASEKREKLFSWVEKQIEIKVEKIEKLQIKEGGFGRTVRDESISRENKGGEEEPGASESYAIKRFNETREEILELKLGILCLVSVRAGNELPDSLDSLLIPHLINVDMYSMLYREKEALMMGTVYLSNSYDIYAQGMINEEFNAYKFSTNFFERSNQKFNVRTKYNIGDYGF